MLSGTHCGLLLLLLLLGGVDVALAVNAFSRFALLALRVVPLLVILLATNRALVVLVPTVPLCFHARSLGTLVRSCLSAALPCGLIPAAASDVASRRVAICRRAASLASVTAWSRSCWSDVEQCVLVMHNEIEPHLPFYLAVNFGWLYSRLYRP